MQIVLTRHGQVEGIDPPRFRGRMELELTDLGRRQAWALAGAIARQFKPDIVLTSPLKRCRDTGAAIAEACGIARPGVIAGFDDVDYGTWQWMTHADAASAFPRDYARWKHAPQWMRFPSGESLQDVAARTADALRDLWRLGRDKTAVLVGHDSVNKVALLQALDLPLSAYWRIEQEPCCINELFLDDAGGLRVMRLNDITHLHPQPHSHVHSPSHAG